MSQPTNEGLIRGIRRWDLVAVAINAIIGAGIFGLPSRVYALVGPYSLIAFFVCAIVVALIVLCFAEVGSRFADTGGPYLYAREAFGPAVGFEVGWLMWLARLTAFAANCNLLVDYLGFFWAPATSHYWREMIILVVVSAIATVNIIGVRNAARVTNVFTIGKLIPIILFIAVGLFFINSQNFTLGDRGSPGYGSFSSSVLMLIYAFSGFEMAAIPAGEVRDPQRNLPRALLTAIGVVALLYITIQLICIGTLPGLATSQRPLADASSIFLGRAGGAIISAGVVVSIVGNLTVIVLSGSRLPFAMSERRELPRVISATHRRYRTPHVSILLTSVICLALTLSSTFSRQVNLSVIARLISYGATCAALLVFRRRRSAPPAMFKAVAGVPAAISALLLAVWLLTNSTFYDARDSVIAAGVGLLIYFGYSFLRKVFAQDKEVSDDDIVSETHS
jgi:APA family basic amino acid/polyamine antiporter